MYFINFFLTYLSKARGSGHRVLPRGFNRFSFIILDLVFSNIIFNNTMFNFFIALQTQTVVDGSNIVQS